jgi:hypothetical protein
VNNKRPITVKPKQVVICLGVITALLVLADIAGQLTRFLTRHDTVYGLIAKFDLDNENNIPTYFSSVILLLSAFLLGVIAVFKKQQSHLYARHWAFLAIIFLCLSLDETASLHEMLTRPVRELFGSQGLFYHSWVFAAVPLVLILGLSFLRFLLHLPSQTRLLFSVAAVLYIGGAVGTEIVGWDYDAIYGENNLTYNLIAAIEETLEMTGIVLFNYALLRYLSKEVGELVLRIGDYN